MNAEVKEYLKEYKTLRVQIAKDEARLKELEEMKDEITANITDERVQLEARSRSSRSRSPIWRMRSRARRSGRSTG